MPVRAQGFPGGEMSEGGSGASERPGIPGRGTAPIPARQDGSEEHWDLRVALRGRGWPKEGRKDGITQAEHPPSLPGARAQAEPAACAGSSPAPLSWAAWGPAGGCLPLSLLYCGHCSANSPLSRAWGAWGCVAAALGRGRSSSRDASHPCPPPEQSLNDKSLRGL